VRSVKSFTALFGGLQTKIGGLYSILQPENSLEGCKIILLTSCAGNKLERETGLSALPREAKPPKGGQINQFPSRGLFPS